MNTFKLAAVAAAALVVSLSALAEGATYEHPRELASKLTRAEVRADLDAARAMGLLASGERSYVAPRTGRGLSRDEVRAELAEAQSMGLLASGERSYVAPPTGRALSRSEVRAELAAALANDELSRGESVFVAESHAPRQRTTLTRAGTAGGGVN